MELFFIVLIVLGLLSFFAGSNAHNNEIENLKNLIEMAEDSVVQADSFYTFISDDSITAKKFKDSSFEFLSESNIELHEPRARRYAGHSGVRVAKGVYLGGSTAKSVQEMTHLSTGNLTLFVDEIVYSSSMETRSLKLANIVDMETFTDGLRISVKNRQKPSLFTGTSNPAAFSDYIQLLKAFNSEFGKSEWNREFISNTIENMKSQYDKQLEEMNSQLKELEEKDT